MSTASAHPIRHVATLAGEGQALVATPVGARGQALAIFVAAESIRRRHSPGKHYRPTFVEHDGNSVAREVGLDLLGFHVAHRDVLPSGEVVLQGHASEGPAARRGWMMRVYAGRTGTRST